MRLGQEVDIGHVSSLGIVGIGELILELLTLENDDSFGRVVEWFQVSAGVEIGGLVDRFVVAVASVAVVAEGSYEGEEVGFLYIVVVAVVIVILVVVECDGITAGITARS